MHRRLPVLLAVVAVVAGTVVLGPPRDDAQAAFPGTPWQTNFEIDGNTTVDGPSPPGGGAGVDWDNASSHLNDPGQPTEYCGNQSLDPNILSGKLQDWNPFVRSTQRGGASPGKGDLCQAYAAWDVLPVYTTGGGSQLHYIVYGAWRRQPTNGSISFFVPLLPVATQNKADVVLIQFDYDPSGAGRTTLAARTWNPAINNWASRQLSEAVLDSAVSSAGNPDFGEFAINLNEAGIMPDDPAECETFNSGAVITRTGASDSASLVDEVAMGEGMNLSNCTTVELTKETAPPSPAPPATFHLDLHQVDLKPVWPSDAPPAGNLSPTTDHFRVAVTVPGAATRTLSPVVAQPDYKVTETGVDGTGGPSPPWGLVSIVCDSYDPLRLGADRRAMPVRVTLTNPDGTYNDNLLPIAPTALLPAAANGISARCTVTDRAPSLTLIKQIDNAVRAPDAQPGMWSLSATGPDGVVDFGPGTLAGATRIVSPGTYTLGERRNSPPAPLSYDDGQAWSCTGTATGDVSGVTSVDLAADSATVCTITNRSRPARLTLQKVVVPGADPDPPPDSAFRLSATFQSSDVTDTGAIERPAVPVSGVEGSPDVTERAVKRGVWDLFETTVPGYQASWECYDGNGLRLASAPQVSIPTVDPPGATVPDDVQRTIDITCTVTNTYAPYRVTVSGAAINPVGGQHTFTVRVTQTVIENGQPVEQGVPGVRAEVELAPTSFYTVVSNSCADPGTDEDGMCTVVLEGTSPGVVTLFVRSLELPDEGGTWIVDPPASSQKRFRAYRVDGAASGVNLAGESHTFVLSGIQFAETSPTGEPAGQGVLENGSEVHFTWTGPAVPTGPTVSTYGDGYRCVLGTNNGVPGTCLVTVQSATAASGTLRVTGIAVFLDRGDGTRVRYDLAFGESDALIGAPPVLTKTWARLEVSVEPSTDVNLTRQPHTFTISVDRIVGGAREPAPGGTVTYTWISDNGSTVSPAGSCTIGASGQCTVTIHAANSGAGRGTLTVTGVVDVPIAPGVTRSVPVTSTTAMTVTGSPATKTWVGLGLGIVPTLSENVAGQAHEFHVQVTGFGITPGGAPVGGVVVEAEAVTSTGSPAVLDTAVSTCDDGTDPVTGGCTLVYGNIGGGVLRVRLTALRNIAIAGQAFEIDPIRPASDGVVASEGLVADLQVSQIEATKTWWQMRARVGADATNAVGQPHTFTVTVERTDDGGVTWTPAPDETTVRYTAVSNPPGAASVVADRCSTPGTVGGSCGIGVTATAVGALTLTITGIRTPVDRNGDGTIGGDENNDGVITPDEWGNEVEDIPASQLASTADDLSATKTWTPRPTITLRKQVVNDVQAPPATPDMWTLAAGTVDFGPGSAAGVTREVDPGLFALTEQRNAARPPPLSYDDGTTWVCQRNAMDPSPFPVTGNAITVAAGDSPVCTITNTATPATLTLVKEVDNSAGPPDEVRKEVEDFTLTAIYTIGGTGIHDGLGPLSGVSGSHAVTRRRVSRATWTFFETQFPGYVASWRCVNANGVEIPAPLGVTIPVVDVGATRDEVTRSLDITCTVTNTYVSSRVLISGSLPNPSGTSHTFTVTAVESVVENGVAVERPLIGVIPELAFSYLGGLTADDVVIGNGCEDGTVAPAGTCTVTVRSISGKAGIVEMIATGLDGIVFPAPVSARKYFLNYTITGSATTTNVTGQPHTFIIDGSLDVTTEPLDRRILSYGTRIRFTWDGPGTPSGPGVSPLGDGSGRYECIIGYVTPGQCAVTVNSSVTTTGTLRVTGIVANLSDGEGGFVDHVLDYPHLALVAELPVLTKTWASLTVDVDGGGVTNLIRGEPHAFTVHVRKDVDGVISDVTGGRVTYTWTPSSPTMPPPAPAGSCTLDTSGRCTVTVGSAEVGSGTLTITGLVDVPLDGVTRSISVTDPGASAGLVVTGSPAVKRWARLGLSITPPGSENLLREEEHVVRVRVVADTDTATATGQPVPGARVTARVVNPTGNLPTLDEAASTCLTTGTDDDGECTLVYRNTGPGSFTVELASVVATINGQEFVIDPILSDTGDPSPGIAADVTVAGIQSKKFWWAHRVTVTPDDATNVIGQPHTFTVRIERSVDGIAWQPVPNGTTATLTWDPSPQGASSIVAEACTSPGTVAGTCTVTVDATAVSSGTLTVTAVSGDLDRDGDGTAESQVTLGPDDFAPGSDAGATKTWEPQPTLTLIKRVVNDVRAPPADPDMWVLRAGTLDFGPGSATGTTRSLPEGTYDLTEELNPARRPPSSHAFDTVTWTCATSATDPAPFPGLTGSTIVVARGDDPVCTVTNTAPPATLTLRKVVDNTDLPPDVPPATVDDFVLRATFESGAGTGVVDGGPAIEGVGVPGTPVDRRRVQRGVYTLSETMNRPGHTATWSCTDLNGTIVSTTPQVSIPTTDPVAEIPSLGFLDITCTVTNRFSPYRIAISGAAVNPVGETHDFTVTVTQSVDADGVVDVPVIGVRPVLFFSGGTPVANTCETIGTQAPGGTCTVTFSTLTPAVIAVTTSSFVLDTETITVPQVSSQKRFRSYEVTGAASAVNLTAQSHTFVLTGIQYAGTAGGLPSDPGGLDAGARIRFTWDGPAPLPPVRHVSGNTYECTVANVAPHPPGSCEVTVQSASPASATLRVTGIIVDLEDGTGGARTYELDYGVSPALPTTPPVLTKAWATFGVTLSPDFETNYVEVPHEFTVDVTTDVGAGPVPATGGRVTYTWTTSSPGIPPEEPPGSCAIVDGRCTVTVRSGEVGTGELTVTGVVDIPVAGMTRSVSVEEPGAATALRVTGSPATKRWGPRRGLAVVKENDIPETTTVGIGDEYSYDVTVENTGTVELTPVRIDDTIPDALDVVAVEPGPGWGCNPPTGVAGASRVTCRTQRLDPGARVRAATTRVRVSPRFTGGTVRNVVVASSPPTELDRGLEASDDDEVTPRTPVRDLSVVKSLDLPAGAAVTPGMTFGYTITVTNTGDVDLAPFTVTDTFPAELTLLVVRPGPGWSCPDAPIGSAGGVVTCERTDSLGPGEQTVAATLQVALASTFTGPTVRNVAVATSPGAPSAEDTIVHDTPVTQIAVAPEMIEPADTAHAHERLLPGTGSSLRFAGFAIAVCAGGVALAAVARRRRRT